MLWIDIGVTALLTLRIALCRPPLPQLVDPNNDLSLPDEKDEQHECLFAVMKKGTNIFLESPHQDKVGLSQLCIVFMSFLIRRYVGDFVMPSQYNLSLRCASVYVEAVRRAFSRLVDDDAHSYQ
jgi:hypothetical protein